MAMLLAGLPQEVPITTINRQCSSGLQAFANIASAIQSGDIEIGIAAGIESMSQNDMMSSVGELNPKVFDHPVAKDCLMGMGETSENVAEKYGISRQKQDEFSVVSHEKALKAIAEGRFKDEIIPVTTKVTTPEGEKVVTVSQDEGPRKTTLADLKKYFHVFDSQTF
jgi:acetyl-CoA acyltransferase 1